MTRFDVPPATPDHIGYLDAAAATTVARAIKRGLLARLDLRPGLRVLDVGCGPGTDLGQLADAVGLAGSVIGVDVDPAMVAEAERRFAGDGRIEVHLGDAHGLELPAASVDRARADRVLQHVDDPARVLAELRRVLRPGGVVGLAEPDWDTLAVDDVDLETSRAFTGSSVGRRAPAPSAGSCPDWPPRPDYRCPLWKRTASCSANSQQPNRSSACGATRSGRSRPAGCRRLRPARGWIGWPAGSSWPASPSTR